MKPDLLKFVSLEGNNERQLAYVTALRLRDGNYDLGLIISSLGLGKDEIPRFLQLVVDAMKGKPSKFDLTPTGIKIVEAWAADSLVLADEQPMTPKAEYKKAVSAKQLHGL